MHSDSISRADVPAALPGEQTFALAAKAEQIVRGYFHDSGSGPIGVFLHGFRSHCNGEKSVAIARHAIARGRSWARFDLRGHGISDGLLAEQDISSALADLAAVLQSLPRRPLVLMGSSMGGWIMLLAALRLRERIAGLLLLAPAINFVQQNFASLPASVLSAWQARGYMTFPDAYAGEPYTLKYGLLADAARYDVMNQSLTLDCPVHVLHGENDEIVPLANSQRFISHALMPRLQFEVIPGGDHRLTDHVPVILRHIDELWRETLL